MAETPDAERFAALERENARLKKVLEIALDLATELELEELMPRVIEKVTGVMNADRSSLFLYDSETGELWTLVAEGVGLKEIRLPAGEGLAGRVATSGEILNIPDAYDCEFFNRSFDMKTGYRTKSVLCVPVRDRHHKLLGVAQVLNKLDGEPFDDSDEEFMLSLTSMIGVLIENAYLYRQIEATFDSVVHAISTAIDQRDPVTSGHSRRVTGYSLSIAEAMNAADDGAFAGVVFSRAELRNLRYACLLHDFGKVGVPEAILQKPERLPPNVIRVVRERLGRMRVETLLEWIRGGNDETPEIAKQADHFAEEADFLCDINTAGFLDDDAKARLDADHDDGMVDDEEHVFLSIRKGTLTDEERRIMESHVVKTYAVLSAIPWPEDMAEIPEIAASHHEALNGKGYPRGLSGGEIPFGGQIMAVADVYDALTAQDRPYKPAIPHEKSCGILRSMAEEGRLNADMVEFFVENRLFEIDDEPPVPAAAALAEK